MARDRVKEQLIELSSVGTTSPEAVATLRRGLRARSALVVAKAAARVAEFDLRDLIADLPPAFTRFLEEPVKTDPGCRAKLQVLRALDRLAWNDPQVFLTGRRYVQLEPVWGGQEDTAAGVRAQSLAGLITMGYRDMLFEAVELLSDPSVEARRLAVKEVGRLSSEAAELVLRLKARCGDREVDVVADCLTELMHINGDRSLEFVATFLDGPAELAQAAAIALGESRKPEALPILRRAIEGGPPGLRPHIPIAVALLRSDASVELLLATLHSNDSRLALATIAALRLFRTDPTTCARIDEVLTALGNEALRNAFEEQTA